jgi:hypothetical protein
MPFWIPAILVGAGAAAVAAALLADDEEGVDTDSTSEEIEDAYAKQQRKADKENKKQEYIARYEGKRARRLADLYERTGLEASVSKKALGVRDNARLEAEVWEHLCDHVETLKRGVDFEALERDVRVCDGLISEIAELYQVEVEVDP